MKHKPLRELSKHLLNLAAHCIDKSENCLDQLESAWLNGTARGYMMSAQIASCRADEELLGELREKEEHELAGRFDPHNPNS